MTVADPATSGDEKPPALAEFVRLDNRGRAVVRNISGRRIERGELVVIAPKADPPVVVEPLPALAARTRCRWTGCTAEAGSTDHENRLVMCPEHAARIKPCLTPGCPWVTPVGTDYCQSCRAGGRDFGR